ncbi:peptidoglycan-recognition protein SC2-like isoform X2 [Dreissena polymorpha]|nr:peptidoglycan-recognition protein SC2-like isoform X2 [Dreissena polymorpha]
MNIDDRVMFSFFDCLLNLLNDTAYLNSFQPAVDARTCLIRLQLDKMPLTEMEVNDTLQKRYKDEGLVLVSRTEWYAQSSKEAAQYMTMPVSHVFIHHTTMNECFSQEKGVIEMRKIQHIHQDLNGWADIGYNFVIGQDGKVYMGRGWDRVGAHTLGWNNKSISFAFTGNFTETLPTDDALNALEAALVLGVKLGKLTPDFKLHGHRDARPETKSPGQKLYNQICKHKHYEPIGPNIETFSPQSRV